MTVLFTELNRIIFTALYRTCSTSHGIEFTVCNRINYVFFKSIGLECGTHVGVNEVKYTHPGPEFYPNPGSDGRNEGQGE